MALKGRQQFEIALKLAQFSLYDEIIGYDRMLLIYNRLMNTAIFLDRDGVIIENREHYVRCWDDVAFIPGALTALKRISSSSYRIIVVTNQSAVGRGLITFEQAESINRRIKFVVSAAGGRIDALYLCPHTPQDQCDCRKPLPGMLLQAAEELRINLSQSFMIGDALSDLMAGKAANVRETILVKTGRGKSQIALSEAQQLQPFHVYDSLIEATDYILNNIAAIDADN